MTDVIKKYPIVINESEMTDVFALSIMGIIWDAEVRSGIWKILELERIADLLNKSLTRK